MRNILTKYLLFNSHFMVYNIYFEISFFIRLVRKMFCQVNKFVKHITNNMIDNYFLCSYIYHYLLQINNFHIPNYTTKLYIIRLVLNFSGN